MNACSNAPLTPPPSLFEAAYHSKQTAASILHSQCSNKLQIPNVAAFKMSNPKQNDHWQHFQQFPDIFPKAKEIPSQLKAPINLSPQASTTTIVITPFSEYSDSEYFSSSFTTYPNKQTPSNNEEKTHLNVYGDIVDESTDYSESESDSEHSYEYPWSADSDDSFAGLSEHEIYQKIGEKYAKDKPESPQIMKQVSFAKLKIVTKSVTANENIKSNPTFFDTNSSGTAIINATPVLDIDMTGIDSMDFDHFMVEYDGDNEDENEIAVISPVISDSSFVITASVSLLLNSDLSGCYLTDID